MVNPLGGIYWFEPLDPLVAFDVGVIDNQPMSGDIVLDDSERHAYVMTPNKVS